MKTPKEVAARVSGKVKETSDKEMGKADIMNGEGDGEGERGEEKD